MSCASEDTLSEVLRHTRGGICSIMLPQASLFAKEAALSISYAYAWKSVDENTSPLAVLHASHLQVLPETCETKTQVLITCTRKRHRL